MSKGTPSALVGRGRWSARRKVSVVLELLRGADLESVSRRHPQVAAGLALRHDHGSQYMSADFQAEIAFLGIDSSPAFVRQPEGNGCIERFFRTLKEQLLWIRSFRDLADLQAALRAFQDTYNQQWLIERLGFRLPATVRKEFALTPAA